ncbi:uncharacterized protein ACN2A1_007574 isoform 2-T3 [Glossina fuscipes fuscipes]
MANFSKFFNEHLSTLNCRDFHEGISCKRHIINSCLYCPLSVMKMFTPIYLLAIIRKNRNLTKEDLKEILLNYRSCIMSASITGITCNYVSCLHRLFFRKYTMYTLIFIPAWYSAHFMFLSTKAVLELSTTAVYQHLTHCLLNRFHVASDELNHILAACCAGLSHFFYPEMALFNLAAVHAFLTLWRMFQIYGAGTENKISKALLNFPYTYVLYPLIQAHCIHIYITRPQLCGPLQVAVNNSFTNNYSTAIMKKVQEAIKRGKGLQ